MASFKRCADSVGFSFFSILLCLHSLCNWEVAKADAGDGVSDCNLAKLANITLSSQHVKCKGPSKFIDDKYRHINFSFSEPRFIKEVIIFNREECCRDRLFPFDLLLIDEDGVERKCQDKSFNVGDAEIQSEDQNKIKIECEDSFCPSHEKLLPSKKMCERGRETTLLNVGFKVYIISEFILTLWSVLCKLRGSLRHPRG